MTGGRRTLPPSKRRGYTPKYAKRGMSHPGDSTVVATAQFAPLLEEIIEELERELCAAEDDKFSGAIEVLCGRVAKSSGMKEESLTRRIYDIRHLKTKAMRAELADQILLAGNRMIGDTDLIEVPAGMVAALERIDTWMELRGLEVSARDRMEMARDLMEFSYCVILGPGEQQQGELAEAA
jgi:hypothetical protein